MTWFRLDDGCTFHAKVIKAGNEAFGAWCRAGSWSSRYLTDGFLPDEVAAMIAPPEIWSRLSTCGRNGEPGLVERAEDGWQIHDYLEWNPSAVEVEKSREELSEKRRKAGVAGNAKRWDGRRKPVAKKSQEHRNDVANDSQTESQVRDACEDQSVAKASPSPDPSRPSSDPTDRVDAPAPPPPVLTNPEPEAPKARKPKQQTLPSGKVPDTVGWSEWLDVYKASRRNYGEYVRGISDGKSMQHVMAEANQKARAQLQGLGMGSADPEPVVRKILRAWMVKYLRDDGTNGHYADNRHPLRCLSADLSRFGESAPEVRSAPVKPAAPTQPLETTTPPPGFDAAVSTMFSAPGGVN
jgi:hypothetical protein